MQRDKAIQCLYAAVVILNANQREGAQGLCLILEVNDA